MLSKIAASDLPLVENQYDELRNKKHWNECREKEYTCSNREQEPLAVILRIAYDWSIQLKLVSMNKPCGS